MRTTRPLSHFLLLNRKSEHYSQNRIDLEQQQPIQTRLICFVDYNGTVDMDGHGSDRSRATAEHARSHMGIGETMKTIEQCLKGKRGRWMTVKDWAKKNPDATIELDLFRRHTYERGRLERHSSWHMAAMGGAKLQADWPNIREVRDKGTVTLVSFVLCSVVVETS